MHFGAAIRDVLSTTCGSDLRAASPRTVVPGLESPVTQRRLAANLEAAFGVVIPDADLPHLATVRDVLQCVRLRRWEARVERRATSAAVSRAHPAAAGADEREGAFRFTRREPVVDPVPNPSSTVQVPKRL